MKKKIMVLLMAAIMVGGVLTGCGNEKEVVEPKNDEEVVLEENDGIIVEEMNDAETNEESVNKDMMFDENTVSFMEVCDAIYGNSKANACSDINVGNIIIYTTKVPATEANGVTETTLFDMYVIDSPLLVKNLNKGYIADIEEEAKANKKPSYDEAVFRDRNDGKVYNAIDGTEKYQITLMEADYATIKIFQSPWSEDKDVESLNLRFIDSTRDGIADMMAFAYEDDDEIMIAVGYANNDASVVRFGANDFWLFETIVSENGEDYAYYTAIEIPDSLIGKRIALDTKIMLEDTSVSHDAMLKTSWGERLQYN